MKISETFYQKLEFNLEETWNKVFIKWKVKEMTLEGDRMTLFKFLRTLGF